MRLTGEPPSKRLKLRKAGLSERARLDFDIAVMEFGESFEREQHATIEVTARRHKGPPKTQIPKYTPKELAAKFLSVDVTVLDEIEEHHANVVDELADDVLSGDADDWLYNPQGD